MYLVRPQFSSFVRSVVRSLFRPLVGRHLIAVTSLACTGVLLLGTGCSSCFVKPVTTEKKGPDLVLNMVDLVNSNNNLKNIPAQKADGSIPALNLAEANYNYIFAIVATDPGGISSLDWSESFATGCPCNPGSNSCPGSNNSGSETITPNPDGTVPNFQLAIINVSAAMEKAAVGCPSSSPNVRGTYTIKAKATNPSNKKSASTWVINVTGP
jgi:hypothetical protein